VSFESLPRQREQNHFNLIRMIAASSVIISHSGNLSLSWDTPDPLYSLIGIDLGATAVLAFFAISGYFISLSFERRTSNSAFLLARVTRIIPALLVVSLACAFLIGPLFTDHPLGAYFSDKSVWLYPLKNISLVGILYAIGLPGVFMHNPTPNIVNGPLWTLLFEGACYAGLFLIGVLGLLRRERVRRNRPRLGSGLSHHPLWAVAAVQVFCRFQPAVRRRCSFLPVPCLGYPQRSCRAGPVRYCVRIDRDRPWRSGTVVGCGCLLRSLAWLCPRARSPRLQ
jgi:peptidoglycan/LPS O-acetylase OafA/YrhL